MQQRGSTHFNTRLVKPVEFFRPAVSFEFSNRARGDAARASDFCSLLRTSDIRSLT
jgi:hypothetical protein